MRPFGGRESGMSDFVPPESRRTFVVVVDEGACTMGTLAMFSAHLVSEHFGDGQN